MDDDYTDKIERRLENIRTDESITNQERKLLLQLHREIKQYNHRKSADKQISGTRHENYLSHGHRLVIHTDVMVDTLDPANGEEPIDEIGDWIDSNYDNGYTQDNYISALRVWGRFLAEDTPEDSEEYPDRFGLLELGNVEDDQPAPEPTEVLFWSHIVMIIEACCNPRTKAAAALLWASGLRPMSEFWELTFGQIEDRGDYMLISVESDSKTFSRTIRIDVGLPYIRDWLENKHPIHQTDREPTANTPVWTHLNKVELIDYQNIRRCLNRAARRAGITKPHNPEHYRKSRASVLAASRWVTQRDLEQHFGWKRGSRVVAHYIAVFSSKSRKHIAKADGASVDLDEDTDPIVPVWCPECARQTPRHRETCFWCEAETAGELLTDPSLVGSQRPEEGPDLLDLITDGEVKADDLISLQKLEKVIKRRDDIWERLPEYIAMTKRMEDDD